MVIEWKNPPPKEPRKCDVVAAELRSNGGEWALIDEKSPFLLAFPWWNPIHQDSDYETRIVPSPGNTSPFGPRDVYARYIGPPQGSGGQ